jgi:hypothetical protein
MKYAETWYCDENCLFEYIKENETEIIEILKEEEDKEGFDNNDKYNNNDDEDNEGDLDYDPMEDF